MFYHQKVARVRVFANAQHFALRAHCMRGIPLHCTPQAYKASPGQSAIDCCSNKQQRLGLARKAHDAVMK